MRCLLILPLMGQAFVLEPFALTAGAKKRQGSLSVVLGAAKTHTRLPCGSLPHLASTTTVSRPHFSYQGPWLDALAGDQEIVEKCPER